MNFCSQPFMRIEIYENGDVFNCCPGFLYNYSIGNIYQNDFEEIWNSEKAVKLREKMLKGDFSQCSDACLRKISNDEIPTKEHLIHMTEYPTEINVSSDNICNVRCRICRDEHWQTPTSYEEFEKTVEKQWLPIFKNAKYVRFGCSGEPFASKKEKYLIKKIVEKFPNIKFEFHTNGILGDETLLKELGVYEKTNKITVSLHSASKKTYNHIVRGGNFDKVCKNLKLYSKMKRNGLIKNFRMIFVVYSENYFEMIDFAKWAQEHNANAEFWAYRHNNDTEIGRNYHKYAIIEPQHTEHKKLIQILKSGIFDNENITLYPELQKIRNE